MVCQIQEVLDLVVCDVLDNYMVEFRYAGESSYVFKPIVRMSQVRVCTRFDSLCVTSHCVVNVFSYSLKCICVVNNL